MLTRRQFIDNNGCKIYKQAMIIYLVLHKDLFWIILHIETTDIRIRCKYEDKEDYHVSDDVDGDNDSGRTETMDA